jgi:phosphoglycolate phosphatase
MTSQAAIFDLDGTLLDTLGDLRQSLESALGEIGLTRSFDDETFKHMVGNGVTKLIQRALPPQMAEDEAQLARVREIFKRIYGQNQTRMTLPYPGLKDLLTGLKAKGFTLGVWSNKDQDNVSALMDHYFPGIFLGIRGAAPDRPIKPAPRVGLELADLLGSPPEKLIYLGDSEVDMETAHGCGFIAVGVSWGFRSKEALQKAGARIVLDKPADLFTFMESLHG